MNPINILQVLPRELISHTIKNLDIRDLVKSSMASRAFHDLASDPLLWKEMLTSRQWEVVEGDDPKREVIKAVGQYADIYGAHFEETQGSSPREGVDRVLEGKGAFDQLIYQRGLGKVLSGRAQNSSIREAFLQEKQKIIKGYSLAARLQHETDLAFAIRTRGSLKEIKQSKEIPSKEDLLLAIHMGLSKETIAYLMEKGGIDTIGIKEIREILISGASEEIIELFHGSVNEGVVQALIMEGFLEEGIIALIDYLSPLEAGALIDHAIGMSTKGVTEKLFQKGGVPVQIDHLEKAIEQRVSLEEIQFLAENLVGALIDEEIILDALRYGLDKEAVEYLLDESQIPLTDELVVQALRLDSPVAPLLLGRIENREEIIDLLKQGYDVDEKQSYIEMIKRDIPLAFVEALIVEEGARFAVTREALVELYCEEKVEGAALFLSHLDAEDVEPLLFDLIQNSESAFSVEIASEILQRGDIDLTGLFGIALAEGASLEMIEVFAQSGAPIDEIALELALSGDAPFDVLSFLIDQFEQVDSRFLDTALLFGKSSHVVFSLLEKSGREIDDDFVDKAIEGGSAGLIEHLLLDGVITDEELAQWQENQNRLDDY